MGWSLVPGGALRWLQCVRAFVLAAVWVEQVGAAQVRSRRRRLNLTTLHAPNLHLRWKRFKSLTVPEQTACKRLGTLVVGANLYIVRLRSPEFRLNNHRNDSKIQISILDLYSNMFRLFPRAPSPGLEETQKNLSWACDTNTPHDCVVPVSRTSSDQPALHSTAFDRKSGHSRFPGPHAARGIPRWSRR
jgi:hypothetical protein